MKSRHIAFFCIALVFSLLLSACGDKTVPLDTTSSEPTSSELTSSELTSSEPISSELTSSEPTSSEPTSSKASSSKPVSSEPPAPTKVTLQERPIKEPRCVNWSAKLLTAAYDNESLQEFDENQNPIYPKGYDELTIEFIAGDGNLEIGAPGAVYKHDGKQWVLLNGKAANEKTEASYLPGGFATISNTHVTGLLKTDGSYKVEMQINGELKSFPFTVRGEKEKPLPDGWERGPESTDFSITLEKNVYSMDTETVKVLLKTGNGVVSGSSTYFALYRYENEEWLRLYQTVPNTAGGAYPPNRTYAQMANVKGYLTVPGIYKLDATISEVYKAELLFDVE